MIRSTSLNFSLNSTFIVIIIILDFQEDMSLWVNTLIPKLYEASVERQELGRCLSKCQLPCTPVVYAKSPHCGKELEGSKLACMVRKGGSILLF